MLYDNPHCSNSYYWANISGIASLLVLASIVGVFLYSLYLILYFEL